ncbi:hypothetical protein Nmel_009253 [Mimus melanotis]
MDWVSLEVTCYNALRSWSILS